MSNSIFDLTTNVSQLSSANEGISRFVMEQVPPMRQVSGADQFSAGPINFRFENSGNRWWVPSKSYFVMRAKVLQGDGTPLEYKDFRLAPNCDFQSHLFQSCEIQLNDKTISRISDYLPQVSAFNTRVTKSLGWMKSVGKHACLWEPYQTVRMGDFALGAPHTEVAYDVVYSRNTDMGFDAPVANGNGWAYDKSDGKMTYTAGTANTGIRTAALACAQFPVGSYFKFVGIDGVPDIPMKVLTNDGTNLVVEKLLAADVAYDGQFNFARVTRTKSILGEQRQVNTFETVYQPPLSLFQISQALPCARWQITMNPQTSTAFQKRAVESILGTQYIDGKTPANFKVEIVDYYLYAAMVDSKRVDNASYLIDLEQIRLQTDVVSNASFGMKSMDISPSTIAVGIAYQDRRAGERSDISASKFKVYPTVVTSTSEDQALKLNRFYFSYAGRNIPQPDASPEFKVGETDYMVHRWIDTQMNNSGYFDTGGCEPYDYWKEFGPLLYFKVPRDGSDRSTRINVHQQFDGADTTQMRLLVFDCSKQCARVVIENSRVISCELVDV
jgi:hypothetical protein